MGRMVMVLYCIAVVTFLGMGVSTAYSEETAVTTKEISGKVVSLDFEKPSIVITPETTDKSKAAIYVSLDIVDTTVIKQGSETVLLEDLLVEQQVTVKYQENDKNQNIAIEILVK